MGETSLTVDLEELYLISTQVTVINTAFWGGPLKKEAEILLHNRFSSAVLRIRVKLTLLVLHITSCFKY